ncbi:MAG TPA: MFS transporter [Armatimonadota bacterium]|jgi:MFS family permease
MASLRSSPAGAGEAGPEAQRLRSPFAPLRHRNYRLFWAGQLVSVTGSWVQSVAQGWLIARLADPSGTHGEAAAGWYLGLVGAAGTLPVLFGALFGGVVADRVEKRRLIMATQAVMMLCAFTLAALTFTHVVRIWHVMALAACLGTATAFDLPARQAFVVEMVGREDLSGAVALNSSLFNAARMVGPAITGALMAARVSLSVCFLLNGLSFLAVIFGLRQMVLPPTERVQMDDNVLSTIMEGIGYARHNRSVRRILTFVAAFGTFAFSFNVLLPAFVRYYIVPGLPEGIQGRSYGLIESVRGVGALAGALTMASLARGGQQRKMLVAGAIGSSIGLVAFSLTRSVLSAYVVIMLVAYCFVCCFASCQTLIQMEVPNELRGRVMSLYVLLFTGLTPIGSLTAGSLARHYDAPTAMRAGVYISLVILAVAALAELRHLAMRKRFE